MADKPHVGLTAEEHLAMMRTTELWSAFQNIVGNGPTRDADLREGMTHIHALQNMILSQGARRAHPDSYRMLGEVGKWQCT
jgi:hypothetical protein